jgi:integrase
MVTLKWTNGAAKARKRLPDDIRSEYQALYGQVSEVKFHRPAGTPPEKAKAEFAAWLAEVEDRIATLRASKGGKGVDITQRQADALAGDWYRWLTSQHLDNAGNPQHWRELREYCVELLESEAKEELVHNGYANEEMIFSEPRELFAKLHDTTGRVSQFLTDRGVVLTQAGSRLFYEALVREFLRATEILERRARGDWGRDQHLDQLAPFEPLTALSIEGNTKVRSVASSASVDPSASASQLFEAYILDKQPKTSTVSRWRGVFTALDAARETEGPDWDAQRWLDTLRTKSRSARTVRDIWLSAARTVFAWAVRKRRIKANPFEGCTVEVPRTIQTRETEKEFTEAEAQTILRASAALGNPTDPWGAAKRWVPWLCAYSGARVGELTQLRVQDIELRTCGPVLRITPDAGTVKTGKARTVPIHPHLVEMGLLDYVEGVKARLGKQGPLFFRPPVRPSRNPSYRGPAVKARERLAGWVRELGVTDPGIQPNHAWRHTFKRRAARAGIEPRIRDGICGHTPRTVAESYELPTVEDMAVAIQKFPRWGLSPDRG